MPTSIPWQRSKSFWGLLSTQFLGAFNDNYFKQLVLLLCVTSVGIEGAPQQPVALAAFALPFVLLSGTGGYFSDRLSKRSIIVGAKVAEIVVMAAGLLVLLAPGLSQPMRLNLLVAVLAFMGAQSAIFGPSKYGSLPELFRDQDLYIVNGAVQMTTFLAIIFGMVAAGVALDQLQGSLWICAALAIGIAVIGTVTSLAIRHLQPARPSLTYSYENVALDRVTRTALRSDRPLLGAIMVGAVFWFVGGVTQPLLNDIGITCMRLNATRTSIMVACVGIGIAAGCLAGGVLTSGRNAARWCTTGAVGVMLSLLFAALIGSGCLGTTAAAGRESEGLAHDLTHFDGVEAIARLGMTILGFSAGLFVVPIQVFVQQEPTDDMKGRMIGAQNLFAWIGILLSAAYLQVFDIILRHWNPHPWIRPNATRYVIFASLAVVMLPIALWFRIKPKQGDSAEISAAAED